MPFNPAQTQAAIAPCFVGARKPIADYIDKVGLDKLYALSLSIGAPRLTRLAAAFYPDALKMFARDLSVPELIQFGNMNVNTLQSLGTMAAHWVKTMLRLTAGPQPPFATVEFDLGNPPGGCVLNANGALDQTSSQPTLQNTVVTECGIVAGARRAVRNLIFNASGNCVAEVNFANHGGTATSGHAHVYPVMCVPLTGHHAMGTPHIDPADYPAAWIALQAGTHPGIAIGL